MGKGIWVAGSMLHSQGKQVWVEKESLGCRLSAAHPAQTGLDREGDAGLQIADGEEEAGLAGRSKV